jgi:hypothetical protein
VNDGHAPAYPFGRVFRYQRADLDEFIKGLARRWGQGGAPAASARTNDRDAALERRRLDQIVDLVLDDVFRTNVPRPDVVREGRRCRGMSSPKCSCIAQLVEAQVVQPPVVGHDPAQRVVLTGQGTEARHEPTGAASRF